MEYQEYRVHSHRPIKHPIGGRGYWVEGRRETGLHPRECLAEHKGPNVSLVRVGVVEITLFPGPGQPQVVTVPNLDDPIARGADVFWVESVVPRGEIEFFNLRARLGGLETTMFRGPICRGHAPSNLMLAQMSMGVELFIGDIDKRLTDPEVDGGHYDLPELTHAREIKAKLEGFAAVIKAPDFLGQLKHSVQDGGDGARDLARALVRFGMKAPGPVNREILTLVYQYTEALRKHQEAGHLTELSGADCVDFIAEHWELGDRGFSEMLAKRPAPSGPTVEEDTAASKRYPGLESSSLRLPDGSTLRVVHDGTIAMLFRETDRDNAQPIATGSLSSIASQATALAEQACPARPQPKKHAATKNPDLGELRQMVANRIARGLR